MEKFESKEVVTLIRDMLASEKKDMLDKNGFAVEDDFQINGKNWSLPERYWSLPENGCLEFRGCVFEKEVHFLHFPLKGELKFSFCAFRQGITFGGEGTSSLKMENCIIGDENLTSKDEAKKELGICFDSGTLGKVCVAKTKSNRVTFRGGKCESFEIEGGMVNQLEVVAGALDKATFKGKGIKAIHIGSGFPVFGEVVFDDNLEETNINIDGGFINHLRLQGKYLPINEIDISNISLHRLTLSSLKSEGSIFFSNINVCARPQEHSKTKLMELFVKIYGEEAAQGRCKELELLGDELLVDCFGRLVDNEKAKGGKYLLSPVPGLEEKEEVGYLEIDKVVVARIDFTNVELEQFKVVSAYRTSFAGWRFVNSSFPLRAKSYRWEFSGRVMPRAWIYEFFNDQYTLAKAQNNKKNQINYYQAAQHNLFLSLFSIKWYKNIPSMLSLLVAMLYSNFGSNWFRSITVTLAISFGFFYLMLGTIQQDIPWRVAASYFVQFLNPVHKFTFMDAKDVLLSPSKCFDFVLYDFIGRIVTGIGIYETVRSFRKFVRS